MSNPRSSTPTQKELQTRKREEQEENRLPDDAVVDVEAEKKEANSESSTTSPTTAYDNAESDGNGSEPDEPGKKDVE